MIFKRFFSAENIFFFGLLLLAISLPLSPYLLSLSQFIIAFAWLISNDLELKLRKFFNNSAALVLCGVYILHVVGVLWSSDYAYALKDLRIKLPLLILPFTLGTFQPIPLKRFNIVLHVFTAAVLISTAISCLILTGFLKYPVDDIRDISLFISPIRFSLQICLCIFSLGFTLYKYRQNLPFWAKTLLLLLCLWFICFLVILESITGLSILITLIVILLFYWLLKQSNIAIRLLIILIIIGVPASISWYVKSNYDEMKVARAYMLSELRTKQGNLYEPFNNLDELENGYPVWAYNCNKELEQAWRLRSNVPFTGKDAKGQAISYTLIRFITSKGLKKDAEGVNALSNKEVIAIEQGYTNVKYQNLSSLNARIHGILWEVNIYLRGGNPSGHSVTQRLEYWKTACNIFKKNVFIGVGTGDINEAFAQQYEEDHTKLDPNWRLKTHNQYLTFAVLFGILGLAYFIFSLLWPIAKYKMYKNYYYAVFFIIVVLSMLTEDTLETQTGVTFFAFFNCLFLFQQQKQGSYS